MPNVKRHGAVHKMATIQVGRNPGAPRGSPATPPASTVTPSSPVASETARIAIQSALTGHLVFSTLHTNDAPSSVTRLVDLGVEPFLVSSSVICVVAQRLVRRVCKECKSEYVPDELELKGFDLTTADLPNGKLWHGDGCEACFKTGYTGRTAIHEVLPITEHIKQQIVEKVAAGEIKRDAVQSGGLRTLRMDGVRKAILGQTTLEEIAAITQRDTF